MPESDRACYAAALEILAKAVTWLKGLASLTEAEILPTANGPKPQVKPENSGRILFLKATRPVKMGTTSKRTCVVHLGKFSEASITYKKKKKNFASSKNKLKQDFSAIKTTYPINIYSILYIIGLLLVSSVLFYLLYSTYTMKLIVNRTSLVPGGSCTLTRAE